MNVLRGLLEFRAAPDSRCAALSGKVLKDMGYERVYNLGGFKDWAESGGEVEK